MKFTREQKYVVAALFARSNMGIEKPDDSRVARLFKNAAAPSRWASLSNAVIGICEEFMESDEHQKIFENEGQMWMKDSKLNSLESIWKIWPDMAELIERNLPKEEERS